MKKFLFLLLCSWMLASSIFAKNCAQEITGNDLLQFNLKEIIVPKGCTKMTLTLKHVGKGSKAAMGHNWVLSLTKDIFPIATDGLSAGLAGGYLKKGDKRVVVKTDLIGGGETTSVTFELSKLKKGGDYSFFCSFPGHVSVMQGKFKYQ